MTYYTHFESTGPFRVSTSRVTISPHHFEQCHELEIGLNLIQASHETIQQECRDLGILDLGFI